MIGVVLLVAVAVVGATAAGAAVLFVSPPATAPGVAFTVSADADADRIALTHEGGDPLSVETLRVRVRIDGEPLAHQPPVPFFAARGFESGPTGPFNAAAEGTWTAGETAGLRIASTNDPQLTPGATVEVSVYSDDRKVADATTTAS